MCMIFKTTREPVKQVGIWLGIVILLPFANWHATALIRPAPDARAADRETSPLRRKISDTEDKAEKAKLNTELEALEKEHSEKERIFHQALFWVSYPVGLAAVVFGILFRVQLVGGGLIFGGLASLANGCYSYWDDMEAMHRFLSLLLALLVLLLMGSWRFWRPAPEGAPASQT